MERKLRDLAGAGAGTRIQAYTVAVNPRVLPLLAGPGGARLAELEERDKAPLLPRARQGHATGPFEVVAEGKLADLRPESPVEEGAELEVKLVEVGLHDPVRVSARSTVLR